MSLAIVEAPVAGALCLGMLSAVVPQGPKPDLDNGEEATFGFEDEFFDVGGPVIVLEPVEGFELPLGDAPRGAAEHHAGDQRRYLHEIGADMIFPAVRTRPLR